MTIAELEAAAECGDVSAMIWLGDYYTGCGDISADEKDIFKAGRYYFMAAKAGTGEDREYASMRNRQLRCDSEAEGIVRIKTPKERMGEKMEEVLKVRDPYKNSAANIIYHLLFCDNIDLYKKHTQGPYAYPFNILFSPASTAADLQNVINDTNTEPRIKMLACTKLRAMGRKPENNAIYAVIVEAGLEQGPDVLASFRDGTARYINQTGNLLVWETAEDMEAKALTAALFENSAPAVSQTEPWGKKRIMHPAQGFTKITLLSSGGLYYTMGETDILLNEGLTKPALAAAVRLKQWLTQKSWGENQED
jgi:hypothetical protein